MSTPSDPSETRSSTQDSPREQPRNGLGLSTPQVAGSALAAVTAAVSASWLGVAGTIVGAALGSVVATVGGAVYTHSLRRGSDVMRTVRPSRDGRSVTLDPRIPWAATPWRHLKWRELPWRGIAVASAAALVLGLGALTVMESITGRPVSTITAGSNHSGTTLGTAFSRGSGSSEQAPADGAHDGTSPGQVGTTPGPASSTDPSGQPTQGNTPSGTPPTPSGTLTPEPAPTETAPVDPTPTQDPVPDPAPSQTP